MSQPFLFAENERHRFCAPVEIHWLDAKGRPHSAAGHSVDASTYGLGIVLPTSLEIGTEVDVLLQGIRLCGRAQVRHVQPDPAGFRLGLQCKLTLFRQGLPELDKVLGKSMLASFGAKKESLVARLLGLIGIRPQPQLSGVANAETKS